MDVSCRNVIIDQHWWVGEPYQFLDHTVAHSLSDVVPLRSPILLHEGDSFCVSFGENTILTIQCRLVLVAA